MRSSTILWALVLALVVVIALLWRPHAPTAGAVTVRGGASTVLDRAPAPESRTPAVDPSASSSPAGARRRDAIEPSSPTPTCRIRVIEATTKAAVPDARVWIQREDVDVKSPAWWKAIRRSNDVEPVLQGGLGVELALDERAEAFVQRPARARILAAARGELHGEATLAPGGAECVIELKPYHSLTIEVVDHHDRPVPGALVVLYSGAFDPLEDWSIWVADADGRVRLPKLEGQFWSDSYRGPVRVSLAGGVTGAPEVVEFTLATTPAEPVRLVAGDFGRVVLQLVDSRGEELALEGRAHLELEEERLDQPSLAVRAGSDVDSTLTSGRAVFETVGLGHTLEVMIVVEGYASTWRDLPGPTVAGQEVRVLVPLGERVPRARGRVHGIPASFGAEHAGATLRARQTPGCFSFWVDVEEGQDFERAISSVPLISEYAGPWNLELSVGGKASVHATAVPALDEQECVVDFGDVRFAPEPELARVRVRDDTGAAVPQAGVEIESPAGERQEWCDDTGLCVIGGPPSALPMRVRATHRDWLPSDWVRVEEPGSETALVVRRGASVLGRLFLARGARTSDFEVRLRIEPGAPGPEVQVAVADVVEDGRFRLRPCDSGRATLTVYCDGAGVELGQPPFELAAGQEVELDPIDLRGVLHPFTLGFVLASGDSWTSGHLQVREPDGELSTWRTIGRSAQASFLSLNASVDLWVAARGGRATFFESVLDGDRLTLTPAPSVRLRLPTSVRPPDPPLALMVRGVQNADLEFETYEDVDTEAALVGEDGTAWLRVARPGSYELHWFVRHSGTGIEHSVEQPQPQTVEVPEASAIPVFEALLGPEELERAIHEAGG